MSLMSYDAAEKWLDNRLRITSPHRSSALAQALPKSKVRANAFFSARVAEDHILDRIKNVSDAYSRGEMNLAQARTSLKKFLHGEGYAPETHVSGEKSQNISLKNLASTARLNLVLRQNALMADAVGMYQVGRDPDIEARWPAWRYIARDGARPSHAAFDNHVYLKSDPIWHTLFPPRDFNCRCTVEECDFEEAQKYGGVRKGFDVPPSVSGYTFDPADAFASFDLSRITDPDIRVRTADGLRALLTGENAVKQNGLVLRVDPSPSASKIAKNPERETYNLDYKTAEEEGFESVKSWDALPETETVAIGDAKKKIGEGFKVKAPDGSEILFDQELLNHWELDKDEAGVANVRLPSLNMAIDTVKNPAERWDQEGQRIYLQKFMESGKDKVCMVTVSNDGKVRSYYRDSLPKMEKRRKGISYERF